MKGMELIIFFIKINYNIKYNFTIIKYLIKLFKKFKFYLKNLKLRQFII